MSTLITELLASVENLKPRLSNRHAEKLIPPVELKNIQNLWNTSDLSEKSEILINFNENYENEQIKRLFQLLARQKHGIQTLISIREAVVKEKLKGKAPNILSDVVQNNLDSALDINRIQLDSDPSVLNQLKTADRVHKIQTDDQFIRRFESDRRVFVFNHKQNNLQPLMLLNIALTRGIASSINDIVDGESICDNFDSAIFYSISSLETGLRGIDLGHRLIISACEQMANDETTINLKHFSSLSPVPSFRRWLMSNLSNEFVRNTVSTDKWTLFEQLVKTADPEFIDLFETELIKICTYYLTRAKKPDGTVECSVGNFHIRNGATLWRINFGANRFEYGLQESLSLMVNYRYYLDDIWTNAHNYQLDRTVPISENVHVL